MCTNAFHLVDRFRLRPATCSQDVSQIRGAATIKARLVYPNRTMSERFRRNNVSHRPSERRMSLSLLLKNIDL